MKKLLSIATLSALAALPLAVQAQDPPAEEPLAQELEYGTETQPVEASDAMPPSVDSAEPIEPLVGETEAQTEVGAGQEELPRTASPLALIALIGAGGAAAGLGVRRLRTR